MRKPLSLGACLALLIATPATAQEWTEWAIHTGTTSRDYFGYAVGFAEDLDGDFLSDFLIGGFGINVGGHNRGVLYGVQGDQAGTQLFSFEGQTDGEQLGMSATDLGDLNVNLNVNFAVGAPYYSEGVGGFWAGKVYILEYDKSSGSIGILDEIEGPQFAGLFGLSMTSADLDGDGQRSLLIGAPGADGTRGVVYQYDWSGSAMDLTASFSGATLGEFYGLSMANGGLLDAFPGEEAIIGAPYASDGAAGSGAIHVLSTGGPGFSVTVTDTDAMLGWSVGGRRDANVDGVADFAAGAPEANAGTGAALVFDGASGTELLRLDGSAAGDRFGYSVALINDTNFDARADLAVGAPYASPGGIANVYDIEAGGNALLLAQGAAPGARFGWQVQAVGDATGNLREDLVIGSPYTDLSGTKKRVGTVHLWAPPDEQVDPLDLSLLGPFYAGEDVDVQVINLKSNVDVRFYVGTDLSGSTQNGVQIDLGGTVTEFDLQTGVTGSTTATLSIDAGTSIGSVLYVQVVETTQAGLSRLSDVESDTVELKPFILIMEGDWSVGQQVFLHTIGGNTGTTTYMYYSIQGLGNDIVPDGFWVSGLRSPTVWPGSPFNADGGGGLEPGEAVSSTQTIPGAAAGLTIWTQAFTFDSNVSLQRWTDVENKVVQP
ncbi:MAG: hypothetical protein DWQ01_10485 [Planctomycetota bacterium]|nr:MAG: hypothetical protein DWQ01_10485 [Planctomycetota bacterium]